MNQNPRVPAYILAGGRSRRFGSDKARAGMDGVPLIVRVARELAGVVSAVTVVAEAPGKYADLGLTTIGDLQPGLGPMGGLQTAMRDMRRGEWLLLASCDLVALRGRWVGLLLAARNTQTQVVAFRHDRWEPLLALYHLSLASEIDRRVAAGELAMQQLLDAVDATALPLPLDWPAICHVNTPAELEQYFSGAMSTGDHHD